MSDFGLFGTLGSALSAQTVRLNTVASNLANADQAAIAPPCSVYILGHPSPKTPVLGGDRAYGGLGRPASATTRHCAP
ncbi:MAG: flagellar basal body protein, partial [Immundisolibacter sp.]|uniref:flagellar basal body protein n=1 Tax=Immundisolibacter sp. TaxID=1934948 RepID=UPI003EE38445